MGFGRIRSRLGVFVAQGRTAGGKAVSFIERNWERGKRCLIFVGFWRGFLCFSPDISTSF